MSELPPELSPWRRLLEPLSPEFTHHLGPWVRRLAAVLGPMAVHDDDPAGEPDGFGGIARRGSYDRLLLTEWGLARPLPFEFLRRAAMGEHLFLHPARRARCGHPRLVALFDAGPEQLGSPRLVHLAVLVVLAERAARAEADFVWGVFQDSRSTLRDSVDPDGFRHLLESRSPSLPGPASIERWHQVLGALAGGEERWWIGGPTLVGLPADGRRGRGGLLSVDEPLAAELEELTLWVTAADRPRIDLRLPLPPPPVRLRLLRDPSRPAVSRARHAVPAIFRGMVFNPDGNRVLARDEKGQVIALQITGGGRARLRRFRPASGEAVVAASIQGRRWHVVTLAEDGLRVHGVGTARQRRDSNSVLLPAAGDGGPLPSVLEISQAPAPCLWLAHLKEVFWMDGEGAVYGVDPFGDAAPQRLLRRALALVWLNGAVCVAVEEPGSATDVEPRSLAVLGPDGRFRTRLGLESDVAMEAHFGFAPRHSPQLGDTGVQGLLLAHRQSAGIWRVFQGWRQRTLRPGSHCRVVGVACWSDGEPGLLVLEDDECTIQHVGLRFARVLVRTPGPVEHVTVAARSPRLAVRFAASAGEENLWILSLTKGTFLMRFGSRRRKAS